MVTFSTQYFFSKNIEEYVIYFYHYNYNSNYKMFSNTTKNHTPILMIGTQRSGSNLLRLMLNQLPEIAAPHPPHILQRFFPLLHHYGNLHEPKNLYQLVEDICLLVEYNPVPWQGLVLNRHSIIQQLHKPTLIEIFRVIYEQKALLKNAKYWCCKSLANVHYLKEIESSGIKPYYLYLYRDGRDVAVSFKKAIVGEKHFYHLAQNWHTEQQLALNHCQSTDKQRIIKVQYEKLIEQPEAIIQEICNRLQIAYNPEAMNYFTSEESKITAQSGEMWANVVNPVMNNNTQKYKTEASLQEIAIFEGIAGNSLAQLRYENYILPTNASLQLTEANIAQFNTINQQIKQQIKQQIPIEDLAKRNKQDILLKQIENRFSFVKLS